MAERGRGRLVIGPNDYLVAALICVDVLVHRVSELVERLHDVPCTPTSEFGEFARTVRGAEKGLSPRPGNGANPEREREEGREREREREREKERERERQTETENERKR